MKHILMFTSIFAIVGIILTLYIQNPVFAILPQSDTERIDLKSYVNSSEPLQFKFDKEHEVSIGDQTYFGKDLTIDPNVLKDGEQSIEWRAVDEIGPLKLTTPEKETSTIVIDSTPPNSPIINRDTLPNITHFEEALTLEISNPEPSLTLLINDVFSEEGNLKLLPGLNEYRVQYQDKAGNTSDEEIVQIENISDSLLSTISCDNSLSIVYPNTSLQLGYSGYETEQASPNAQNVITRSNSIVCDQLKSIRAPETFTTIASLFPIGTTKFCFECGVFDEQYISILVGPEGYTENQDPFLVNYSNETYTTASGIEGLLEKGGYNFPGLSPDQLYPPDFSFQSFSFKTNNRTVQIRMEWDDFKASQTDDGAEFYKNIEQEFEDMIDTVIADF